MSSNNKKKYNNNNKKSKSSNNKSNKPNDNKSNKPSDFNTLLEVPGLGPSLARQLYTIYEVKTKNDLKKPLIFDILPIMTQYDLIYNPLRKIPHQNIKLFEKYLAKHLIYKGKPIKHQIAGSYRRGKPYSNDIDIIIENTVSSWQNILNMIGTFVPLDPKIKKNEFLNVGVKKGNKKGNKKGGAQNIKCEILPPYAWGEKKISTYIKFQIGQQTGYSSSLRWWKIDMFITDKYSYNFMLLFATGSGKYNMIMREVAKRKGMLLNQYGLYRDNEKISGIKSEKDIFKVLGMTYREPKDRII